jgi:hypothetical protein
MLPTGLTQAWKMDSVAVLAFDRGGAEGRVRMVALLEGELEEAH